MFSSFKGESSLPFFFEKGGGRDSEGQKPEKDFFFQRGWLFEGVWVGKIVLTTHKRLFVNAARRVWGRPRILINGDKGGTCRVRAKEGGVEWEKKNPGRRRIATTFRSAVDFRWR